MIWDLLVLVFFIFPSTSKIAPYTQYLNNKYARLSHKEGSIGPKKFQRFQKWGQVMSETLALDISQTLPKNFVSRKFQNQILKIFWDMCQIDFFSVPDHMEVS